MIDDSKKAGAETQPADQSITPDMIPVAVTIPQIPKKESDLGDEMSASITVQAAQFSGPLPPPALLEHYNEIQPGAADRIIRMAEEQSAHRREMESRTLRANNMAQLLGPILGFVLAMTIVLGGIWLVSKGQAVEGLVALITAIGGLVGVFVYGKHQQKKEMELESQMQKVNKNKKNRRRK